MAKGPDDFADDWVDGKVAVSGYVLSASVAYFPASVDLTIVVQNSLTLVRIIGGFYSACAVFGRGQAFNSS